MLAVPERVQLVPLEVLAEVVTTTGAPVAIVLEFKLRVTELVIAVPEPGFVPVMVQALVAANLPVGVPEIWPLTVLKVSPAPVTALRQVDAFEPVNAYEVAKVPVL